VKSIRILLFAFVLAPALLAPHDAFARAPIFSCAIGAKRVLVLKEGSRFVYHFGAPGRDELSIVGDPDKGNIFGFSQLYAGPETQIRFVNGGYSFIVYSMEGNTRTGASAVSGLMVLNGGKAVSDASCAPYASLDGSDDDFGRLPQDTEDYSAMAVGG